MTPLPPLDAEVPGSIPGLAAIFSCPVTFAPDEDHDWYILRDCPSENLSSQEIQRRISIWRGSMSRCVTLIPRGDVYRTQYKLAFIATWCLPLDAEVPGLAAIFLALLHSLICSSVYGSVLWLHYIIGPHTALWGWVDNLEIGCKTTIPQVVGSIPSPLTWKHTFILYFHCNGLLDKTQNEVSSIWP